MTGASELVEAARCADPTGILWPLLGVLFVLWGSIVIPMIVVSWEVMFKSVRQMARERRQEAEDERREREQTDRERR